MRCPITLRVGKYKLPFQALIKHAIWACRTTTPWCGRVGANSATWNDTDMVTGLHHRLIAGKGIEEWWNRWGECKRQKEKLKYGSVHDWGETRTISYTFTHAVLDFCIYETLSIPEVKDQSRESKASVNEGQSSKKMWNPCEACSLSNHLPLYSLPLLSISAKAAGLDWMWKSIYFNHSGLGSCWILFYFLSK